MSFFRSILNAITQNKKKDISARAEAAANCSGLVSTRSFRRSDLVWGDAPHINAVTLPFFECWKIKNSTLWNTNWGKIKIKIKTLKKKSRKNWGLYYTWISPRRRPIISSVSVENAWVAHVNQTSSDIFTLVRDIFAKKLIQNQKP